jgi:hypothetical protein
MSSEIIYQGIYITAPGCKYFQVKTGSGIRCYKKDSVYTIEFPEGTKSEAVADRLGLKHIGGPQILTGMARPERFGLVQFSLNGLKFWRMTYDPHIIKIIIVSDSESRIVQSYRGTTIVVSKDDYANPEFVKYVFGSGGLQFIKLAEPVKCIGSWEFRNFPFIPIYSDTDLESESKVVYSLRNRYDDYLIRSIDYQEQFIKEMRRILEDYGCELVRVNREETLKTTNYVSYNFSQTPVKEVHPKWSAEDNGVLAHRVPVDFELHCTNMQMFYDFKNKYNNVDLLTNMCEFRVTDRYGERWTASVKWGPITEDFSQQYNSDSNSNFSYQCSFRAELFFNEVYDRLNALIQTIYYELEYD